MRSKGLTIVNMTSDIVAIHELIFGVSSLIVDDPTSDTESTGDCVGR